MSGWRASQSSFFLWVLRLSRTTLSLSGIGGHDLVHELQELLAAPALLVLARTLPVATSYAANSVVVPCRL